MSIKNIITETMSLHVGDPVWSRPDQSTLTKAGVLTCGGMSIFGDCSDIGGIASVTIGTADGGSLQKNKKLSLHVKGNTIMNGDKQTPYALTISGGSIYPLKVNGDAVFTALTPLTLSARFELADDKPFKPFDIQHPIKGDGWRLRYASLEGPEAGVYCRGRLKESNVIKLPDYWEQLVHTDSISVQLQPIGDRHFHLNVVSFDNKEIIIKEADDKPIDCFYHVYGERKDVNSLIVEYEGNGRYDYPDPNFNENSDISPEDRNYKDPKYSSPRNIITS